MQWTVVAPFITTPTSEWLAPAVGEGHQLVIVPRVGEKVSWHDKRSPVTSPTEWVQFVRQAHRAISETSGGVITVFPQLASIVGAQKQLRRRADMPVVSWFFNTATDSTLRLIPARATLRSIDKFVVHSSREIEAYARQLHLPEDRFDYVPLQYGGELDDSALSEADPFIFATGSGYRDYGTFFDAVSKLGYRTVVLASEHALAGTNPPANVEILQQVSKPRIRQLIRQARINVVPMNTDGLTAGLVTIVEAFCHGRALVATERPGCEDYLLDDENALLVPPGKVEPMVDALEAMWNDDGLRCRLNKGALSFAEANCTDEAAGRSLTKILTSLSDGY